MNLRGAVLAVVIAGVCAGSAGTSGCVEPHACTLIGCSDTEELTISSDVATLSNTLVDACRNEICAHGSIDSSDLTPSASSHVIQLLADGDAGSVLATCTIDVRDGSNAAALSFGWMLETVGAAAKGDVLSVKITLPDGTVRLNQSGTLSSFTSYYPNGKDCDQVACLNGTVQGSNE